MSVYECPYADKLVSKYKASRIISAFDKYHLKESQCASNDMEKVSFSAIMTREEHLLLMTRLLIRLNLIIQIK